MDFPITIDNSSQAQSPLHRQIYDELRKAILSGRLAAGKKVPSTREMSKALGVARATVTLAYDYLLSEGYLEAYLGSGTYVSRKLPEALLEAAPDSVAVGAVVDVEDLTVPLAGSEKPRQLSEYGRNLQSRYWLKFPDEEPEIQFSFGRPYLDEFPMKVWSHLMTRHCRNLELDLLDCPTKAGGYAPLKEAIAGYLSRARAVVCDPEQVIVVNGSQQAVDLVTRVMVDPGDIVGIEEPGYFGAQKALEAQGAKLSPIYVDRNGVRVDYLKSRFGGEVKEFDSSHGESRGSESKVGESLSSERLKLLYVTPSHQYPTGVVLSLPRRMELLSWASRTGTIIVEDDYDSEYRYTGRPIPALAGIDNQGSVIYVGTFSKVLVPALRLGYLVVPKDLIEVFTRAKWLVDRHSSLLQQQVLADFIREGFLERHIRKMRAVYQEKRKLVLELLNGLFEDTVTIYGDNAGINVLVRFNTSMSDIEIVERARQLGVGIAPTQHFYIGDAPTGEYLLNYGGLSDSEVIEGLTRLHAVIGGTAAIVSA